MVVKVQLDSNAYMPIREHADDAGADLRTPKRFVLHPGEFKVIDTGVHIQTPCGYAWFVKSKSGLMTKKGILTDGLVDAGYSGSIHVCLFNHSRQNHIFEAGDKIAQIVLMKVETPYFKAVDEIDSGERGNNGFGSTGR